MPYQKRLSPLDLGFLAAETRESMMHVGALMQFSPASKGACEDFLVELMDEIKREATIEHPWNLKLRHPELLASPLQAWVEDTHFDAEYHVRRSALPRRARRSPPPAWRVGGGAGAVRPIRRIRGGAAAAG